jgi:hypothetical protein
MRLPWALGSLEFLVQAGDDKLAEIVHAAPIAMLANKACGRAIKRWTYAAWYSRTGKARDHAAAMLKIVKPKGPSPPEMVRYTPVSLAAAYEDLVEYGEGLHRCVKAATSMADVLKNFPDCALLEHVKVSVAEVMASRRF